MGDGQQPLDDRQELVEVLLHIRIVDLQMDRLLLVGRWVLIGEEDDVRHHPCAEASELAGEVEPPPWVFLPEHDHQRSCEEEPGADAPGAPGYRRHDLARLGHDGHGVVTSGGQECQDDHDGKRPDEAEEGGQPIQALGVVDVEPGGVGLGGRGHGVSF